MGQLTKQFGKINVTLPIPHLLNLQIAIATSLSVFDIIKLSTKISTNKTFGTSN